MNIRLYAGIIKLIIENFHIMFDDINKIDPGEEKKNYKINPALFSPKTVSGQDLPSGNGSKKTSAGKALGAAALVFILILAGALWFFSRNNNKKMPVVREETGTTTSPGLVVLPVDPGDGNGNGNGSGGNGEVRAETISFADYYREPGEYGPAGLAPLALPLNAKAEVVNYYETSRNISLDACTDNLNNYGFAVIANPFGASANDFFGAYRALNERRLPLLITTDFIFYYYNTVIHQIFRSVESHVFFDYIWRINKNLFLTADSRYREGRKSAGLGNDPLLEAMRREAAFFAVTLELLKPRAGQFAEAGKPQEGKFTRDDVDKYEFILPDYLRTDVPREVELILNARKISKSPVLLYEQDYSGYQAPSLYSDDVKLNNYFLATKWLNSLYPLYPRDSGCPDCPLDQDDWLINFIAAGLIAQDFSRSQELKNDWAKIYKVISYYSGLRRELTYLHYADAWRKEYGDDYDVKKIFSGERSDLLARAKKLAGLIADQEFLGIEGGLSRGDPAGRPGLGMRMLQEPYWPNEYIVKLLTYPSVGAYGKDARSIKNNLNVTGCSIGATERILGRCSAIGLDIINLVYPLADNQYFAENSDYAGYSAQAEELRRELADFDKYSWHNNIYWTTIDISRKYLQAESPLISPSAAWQDRKIKTALGGWAAIQLPPDELSSYYERTGGFGSVGPHELNYIEPEIVYAGELLAKASMLAETLLAVRVIEDTDYINREFKKIIGDLATIKGLIEKTRRGEALGEADAEFIDDLATQYAVAKPGDKSFILADSSKQARRADIAGINLLILIYEKQGGKYLAAGPVFKYEEK